MSRASRRALTWGMGLVVMGRAFSFAGCDAQTRETILQGTQSATVTLMTALLEALFASLEEEPEQPVTTVWLPTAASERSSC